MTRAWILVLVLLLVSVATVPVGATPPTDGDTVVRPDDSPPAPDPPTTPPPDPSNEPTAPVNGPNTGNESDGGLLGGSLLDRLGPLGEVLKDPTGEAANATREFTHGVLLTIAYVPAPNSMENYFREPTNGIWPGRWETYDQKARPLFWAIAGVTFLLYLLGAGTGTLPRSQRAGWARKWLANFIIGYMAWTIAGAWLTARKGMTYWLLQDVTAATLETTLTAALVLVAVLVIAIINVWILAVLLLIVGMVYGGVAILTPWLGVLIMARSFPIRIVAAAADRLAKFWFLLTFLTLPIAAFVGAGFSLDVAASFNPDAVALSNPSEAATEAALALFSIAVKFGTILGGILAAWWLFSGLQSVGMATGVVAAPSPEQLQQRYKRGREQAGKVRERSQTVVNAPREIARGARGQPSIDSSTPRSRSYDAGRVVRDYATARSSKSDSRK